MTIDMVRKYESNLTVGKAIGFYFLSLILILIAQILFGLILMVIGLGANADYFPSDQIICMTLALLVLRKYGYSENEIFSTPAKVNLPLWILITLSTISLIPVVVTINSCVIKIFPMPQFWVELGKIVEEHHTPNSLLECLRLIILGGVLTGMSEEFFNPKICVRNQKVSQFIIMQMVALLQCNTKTCEQILGLPRHSCPLCFLAKARRGGSRPYGQILLIQNLG